MQIPKHLADFLKRCRACSWDLLEKAEKAGRLEVSESGEWVTVRVRDERGSVVKNWVVRKDSE